MEHEENPLCTGRRTLLKVNAMGAGDVATMLLERGGDIDFSSITREPIEIEDINEIDTDKAISGAQVAGGFEAVLWRVAYHANSGGDVDSSYHIEELIGPGDFHDDADMTSKHPDIHDVMRSSAEQSCLAANTEHPTNPEPRATSARLRL